MTPDQIIAISASIGTCLSAFATFLTVRQIIKQREASYRPELIISSLFIESSQESEYPGSLNSLWKIKQNEEIIDYSGMTLLNIGLGSAKNIKITWSFPFESLVKNINELAQKSLSAAYFSFENGMLRSKLEKFQSIHPWRGVRISILDFVLPVSVQKDGVLLRLPPAYIYIISAYYYIVTKGDNLKEIQDIPTLRADLEFFDIGEKIYKTSFEISFQLSLIHGKSIHGELSAKKV